MSGKLYWRIKKNGKWTWAPAQEETDERLAGIRANYYIIKPYKEEEKEVFIYPPKELLKKEEDE